MFMLTPPTIVWLTVLLQVTGLVTLVVMRLACTRQHQACCQSLFFVTLLALGVLTVLAVGVGESTWMASGTSLSATAVAATLDFRGDRRADTSY
jgi:hypothetical protein